MNSLDIYNYGLSTLVVLGTSGATGAVIKYGDQLLQLIDKRFSKWDISHRIVIEWDPSTRYESPMML